MSDCTATGTAALYLPPGPECDEVLRLVRIGLKFERNHRAGGHPGFLRSYITGLVAGMKPPVTFADLLHELRLEASRRELSATGKALPPVISVNMTWELVTYHHPKRGEVQTTFGNLRNILTKANEANSLVPAVDESGLIRLEQV